MPAPSKQRLDQLQQEHGQRSSVIVASGLEGFLSLSALLKPEVAAVFSAMVAGGSEGPLVVTGHGLQLLIEPLALAEQPPVSGPLL
jgi:hypothetical protein